MSTRSVDVVVRARDELSRKFGRMGKASRGLGQSLKALRGVAMTAFAALGGAGVGYFLKGTLDAYGRQEQAVEKLRAALDLLGAGSPAAVRDMEAFAASIQKVTTVGDEAVLELATLGAGLGRLSGQGLKDATQAAIGLSRRLGTDAVAAMRLVARAAIGDTSQLARYGIKLDETLSAQAKFNELLRMGSESFALAEAEANTYPGRMEQLSAAWGDLKEQIGEQLAPSLKGLAEDLTANIDQIGAVATTAISAVKEVGKALVGVGAGIAATFDWLWVQIRRGLESTLAVIFAGIQNAMENFRRLRDWLAEPLSAEWLKGPGLMGGDEQLRRIRAAGSGAWGRASERIQQAGKDRGLLEYVQLAMRAAVGGGGYESFHPKGGGKGPATAAEAARQGLPWMVWPEAEAEKAGKTAADAWLDQFKRDVSALDRTPGPLGDAVRAFSGRGTAAALESRFLREAGGVRTYETAAMDYYRNSQTLAQKQIDVQERTLRVIEDIRTDSGGIEWRGLALMEGG